ncbi:MAG TPA: penicillin-binding transpeptidase domain-containing protein [Burkholderiaceae bacterium]|nr:penicillin-binding transpeptidase domain-containing protein [Burkholderiaceae bacterium]
MRRTITYLLQVMAAWRTARRRQANLRAGARPAGRAQGRKRDAAAPLRVVASNTPAGPDALSQAGPVRHRHALVACGAVVCVAGAGLIAGHARHLAAATQVVDGAGAAQLARVFQPALPGARFQVPGTPGVRSQLQPNGALVMAVGMQAAAPVRVDLCSQLRAPGQARMVPLRLGYRFDDVRRWVERGPGAAPALPGQLHNVLLVDGAADGAAAMPELQLSGQLRSDFASPASEPLQLRWHSLRGAARWVSDATLGQIEQGSDGQAGLREQGWLTWDDGAAALRLERRNNALCPQAGELLVQLYRLPSGAQNRPPRALVTAFPARAAPLSASLPPGDYLVPDAPPPPLEDQMLFESLRARGLVRVRADGAIDLAPRDLPQWLASPASARAAGLAGWQGVTGDAVTARLLKRLYYQADGDYVRQQLAIYNDERHLLAWRVKEGPAGAAQWQASALPVAEARSGTEAGLVTEAKAAAAVAEAKAAAAEADAVKGVAAGEAPGMPLATSAQMPAAAASLFAELPQGWQPWTRVARWPQAASAVTIRLQTRLSRPATAGETLQLLLIGQVRGAAGARARTQAACTGRACATPGDVQLVTLSLLPGVRSVQLDVSALRIDTPADRKYRHLAVVDGHPLWQALGEAGRAPPSTSTAAVPVQLQDRNGTPLWADGAPTQVALDAGMATLLGVNARHASGIAGVLARRPAPNGGPVPARLTLDLPLQALSQSVLDCVAMRRGHWDGHRCAGGGTAPEGRHAGIVMLDTETGDVLAAAGAGTGIVNAANWAEVRDFDRANPARSALRLPALQHDGGAHQSPGSTFKIVSALGLELAAQRDPQLDGLLAGLPLGAINRMAAQRGFGFQTDAATYPFNTRLAHITNYKEQSVARRAQDGRLGLAQALTYSLNTWFAWSGELSDASLFGRPDGGAPDLQALDAGALDTVRPILAAAHRLGFGQPLRLDGGLLPSDFNWQPWDALQATPAHIDPIHTRHELRQMSIGLRMQATPLQMALAAGAVGQGAVIMPRMLLALDGKDSNAAPGRPLGIRLDRIRVGMKGVIDVGTAAGAFGGPALAALRPHLYGKTGTAPSGDGTATVWFAGWLEAGSLPGQTHRLALAVFASHSEATGGEHAAPVAAAILATLAAQNREQKGK